MALETERRNAQQDLSGKSFSNKKDIRDPFVYFDTATLAHAAATIVLFNNGSSSKNLSISNYPFQALPTGQSFDIHNIRLSYTSHAPMVDATQQYLLTWLACAVLQIGLINQAPKYERTLAGLIGGQTHAILSPAATYASRNMTSWTADTVVSLKKKIYIDQNVQLQIKILQDAAANAALDGDLVRLELIGRQTTLLG
jgi:hypothetical protein